MNPTCIPTAEFTSPLASAAHLKTKFVFCVEIPLFLPRVFLCLQSLQVSRFSLRPLGVSRDSDELGAGDAPLGWALSPSCSALMLKWDFSHDSCMVRICQEIDERYMQTL